MIKMISASKRWLRWAGPEFYHAGIQTRWHKAVERDADYVPKECINIVYKY
jgi:hypothetical protein